MPAAIQRDEQVITDIDSVLKSIESGDLQTGPIAGRLPALSSEAQTFDLISGEQAINKISSATFGQLSEGERKFIQGIVANRRLNEDVNIRELQQLRDILVKAVNRNRKKLGLEPMELPEDTGSDSDGWQEVTTSDGSTVRVRVKQ